MKGIYDCSDKECSENGENKSNINDEKNKIIRKYMSIVEDEMKNDSENLFDNYELNSNDSKNQTGESNYPDSNDDIILYDADIKNSILGNSDWETRTHDNNCDNAHNNGDIDKLNESSIINKCLSNKDTNNIDQIDKSDRNDICSDSEMINDIILEKDKNNEKNKEDVSLSEYISTQMNEEEIIQGTKETINKTDNLQLDIDNFMEFKKESTNFQSYIKECVYNLESIENNEKKNSCFFMEIKDLNEWKEKHRYLTSSYRRMEKKLNKIINSESIHLGTRRSLKQHKDFLDNEYKEWLCVLQKIVSEYKKNIGAQVSELNEKEYFILSKNIYEDFKGNHLEELNISNVLFLLITKHQIKIDDDIVDYLEQCYETINKDKTLNNIIQKVNDINKNIEDIGGETGSWDSDQNNYFMEVYENNIHLGDEIICGILKNGLNKNENEILEHIEWYRKFVSCNTLRNKWLNSINIINTNDQKKSNLKIQKKKQMIQLWKDKKKHESEIKNKKVEQMKKDELKIQRKIRDDIKKKKELLQNELNKKKDDMKKNKIEKRQKSILSEEMLQRINERNERILQKKVQSNVNLNDDNNEKNKKQSNQKYMHVQSKLLSNTGIVN
ncbi:conserved Plasmodium protein, unknown function [Plasmodium berghei]|uniref:Uncharacterized protein n=2 Tax=Plasmodium berghei TaxID=5821 RepID=A0A509AH35_PLABA|nr:conserved Plasmodium protein, unknown function [Plasmodium berghei ANKA]CXI30027.1 conserved Plasmodium protein, unknown function [Plasmodium berghei]SCM20813.1 conserved Plasmodium protein, unknown function [Plasmodium berghei]SCN24333.1 conserved Plasmodium protein, unknown function [Plasmodium berghei]SCO60736.1 conserved Plasmodium protein, unknown function [Plasmodium berghei]VUC55225.1 conserved Plasmodium protein, unknown function [Plasmodium berghei ANKA]|eukprot:XP_034421038.1 conserved Plasmodium protein, unknown function [Plasmodium berghei ANKA]